MDKICILPWIHTEFTTEGTANPCCLYRGDPMGNLKEESLLDIWHGEKYNNLRQEFLDGKQPKGCAMCWQNEDAGYKSKRLQDNEKFSSHLYKTTQEKLFPPIYLDLKFGTLCNLKCRSCGSVNSSSWKTDEKLIYGRVLDNKDALWVKKNPGIWDELDKIMHTVEHMDFTGGEPFMIEQHFDLLKHAVESGHAKNISIHYNTNGTIRPPKEIFDLWKEFKSCEVMFSIDGIFNKFEYIRSGAVWDEVWENFNHFKSHEFLSIQICHTVSIFNVYYLEEFVNQFEGTNIYFNLLHFPRQYCIRNMPDYCKERVREKIINIPDADAIVNFMMQEATIDKLDLGFYLVTDKLDKVREEDYSKTFAEFYEILINGGIRTRPWEHPNLVTTGSI